VQSFLSKHADKITEVLSCFDRLIFKGYLPISYPQGMENFLQGHDILLKDFKAFGPQQAQRLKEHAQTLAAQAGRPFLYCERRIRKEEQAQDIARRDHVTQGLICVFSVLETCPTCRILYGKGRPRLKKDYRRCLVLYYYFLDPEFGLLHIRIPTWFPLTIQVYLNGHEWLARTLDQHGLGYQRRDNAFLALDDPQRAQALADRLLHKKWPRFLNALAKRVNPLLGDLLQGCSYTWVTDQAEFATDVLFKDRAALQSLYPRLLEHATLHFRAEDVLSYLGRKMPNRCTGEVLNDTKKQPQGFRVKHHHEGNWLKMYDKFGQVLRIEVVINRPQVFQVRRWGTRKGQRVFAWFALRKNVVHLGRYAEVSLQATGRYLAALAVVDAPQVSQRLLDKVCERVPFQGRTRRGLNPLSRADQHLFTAVLRGEHALRGFSSRDVAGHLGVVASRDPKERRRQSARISRSLQLLRAHGLIAKIPHRRRYRVTARGFAFMSTALHLRFKAFPAQMSDVG